MQVWGFGGQKSRPGEPDGFWKAIEELEGLGEVLWNYN
jgi:hypothetical protein